MLMYILALELKKFRERQKQMKLQREQQMKVDREMKTQQLMEVSVVTSCMVPKLP